MPKEMKKLLLLLLSLMMVVSCARKEASSEDSFTVVAIDFPSYDAARFLLGDDDKLVMLLRPGVEMHSYDPTPKDMIEIADADLVVFAGGPSDEWVYRILESTENASYFTLLSAVKPLFEEHVEGMEADSDEEDEIDEHVWTSPINEIAILKALSEKLCEMTGKSIYEERFEEIAGKLEALDNEFRQIVEDADINTLLFASRFPLRYFTEEYGLDYYAAFPGCAEESEPSAKTVAFLIDKARELNVPCILNIELSSSLIANTIADEAGCKVKVFQSIHNVTPEDYRSGADYLTLMERNKEVLREALNAY